MLAQEKQTKMTKGLSMSVLKTELCRSCQNIKLCLKILGVFFRNPFQDIENTSYHLQYTSTPFPQNCNKHKDSFEKHTGNCTPHIIP